MEQVSFTTNYYNYNEETPDMALFDIHYCFAGNKDDTKDKKQPYKSLHGKIKLTGKMFCAQSCNSLWNLQKKLYTRYFCI